VLNAYSLMIVADLVELQLTNDSFCVDDSNNSTCAASMLRVMELSSIHSTDETRQSLVQRAVGSAFYDRDLLAHSIPPIIANQATHWLDGSHIYGANADAAMQMRTWTGGQLSTDRSDWPTRNGPVQLVVLVDLFVREHNRRARAAALQNATCTDDELFDKARRLVIAALQRIAIDEWLPQLTGMPLDEYDATAQDSTVSGLADVFDEEQEVESTQIAHDSYQSDTRGDVTTTFAFACAPALVLSGERASFASA
jgi:hypothetical protein